MYTDFQHFSILFLILFFVCAEFSRCGKEMGLLLPFKCRRENDAMKKCMTAWSVEVFVANFILKNMV